MLDINPVLFSIGPVTVRWYAVIIVLGFIAGIAVAMRVAPLYRWTTDDIFDFAMFLIPITIIGARFYYVATSWDYFSQNPGEIVKIWHGGLAIYGGLIAGALWAVLFCKRHNKNVFDLLDIAAAGAAIGQAIGRWGNFVNQEAFGTVVTNPKWQWFPFSVFIQADGQWHYATFFYESFFCFLLFIFLMCMRRHFRHRGDVILSYFMLYGLERFFVEGLRTDSLYVGRFRISQVLSLILFVGIGCFFLIRRWKERGKPVTITNKANPKYIWPDEDEKVVEATTEKDQHENEAQESIHRETKE